MNKGKFLIFYTGGTIGMRNTANGLDVSNYLSEILISDVKKTIIDNNISMKNLTDVEWDFISVESVIDSSNVDVKHWNRWLKILKERIPGYNGILILHGTDTLAYTANILSFALINLPIPIILTGAQLPYENPKSDAHLNLKTALKYLSNCATKEVVISFGGEIWRGVGSRKYSTESIKGLLSPHYKPIEISNCVFNYDKVDSSNFDIVDLNEDISIATYFLTPVGSIKQLINDLYTLRYSATIIQSYGHGNAPLPDELVNAIKYYISNNKVIVNITQVWHGQVFDHYSLGREWKRLGVFQGGSWTIETATSKLLVGLSLNLYKEDLINMLLDNKHGEWDRVSNSEIDY